MTSGRRCGECTLCCKVLPVAEISKPANTVCAQQRSKGCRVYGTAKFPRACRVWTCLWLRDESLPLRRPDHSRYVIDTTPDFVMIGQQACRVVQIWIDPRSPLSHRDPALREWLATRWAQDGVIALVRFDETRAIVLLPPEASPNGCWLEAEGTQTRAQHSPAEIAHVLREIEHNK